MLTGALSRYPRIRVVVADAGSVLPLLASRLELLDDDTLAAQLAGLWTSGVWPGPSDRVVYGSGHCFTPRPSLGSWPGSTARPRAGAS